MCAILLLFFFSLCLVGCGRRIVTNIETDMRGSPRCPSYPVVHRYSTDKTQRDFQMAYILTRFFFPFFRCVA